MKDETYAITFVEFNHARDFTREIRMGLGQLLRARHGSMKVRSSQLQSVV